MRIIGYTFDADCHCVSCARKRFALQPVDKNQSPEHFEVACRSRNDSWPDVNAISQWQRDNEGNPIHPLFSTDEFAGSQFCGDCHERIE